MSVLNRINSQDEVLLSQLDYNENGQVIDKKIHSANASSFLQSIDYTYNINGWLTSINNPDGADPQDPDDFFAMSFAYETDAFTSVSSPRKDGYITASKWRSSLNYDKLNLYNFDYDNLHRLMGANYRAGKGSTWTANLDFYSEKGIAYDLNGNITKMKHYDIQVASSGATSAGLVDDLVYGYGTAGNKLLTVSDNGTAAIRGKVFKDGNTTGNDYEYDLNGNLINDKNKKITITYNRYNQPAQVSFSDSSIVYAYSATGAKLSEAVFSGANEISRKEYFGAFLYEKNQSGVMDVSRILHSSGFLLKNAGEFEYYYYLTDQVGSPRVVLRTLPSTSAQTATVEPEELPSEQSEFLRVENVKRVQSALFDKTNDPASGYSVRLNGSVNEKYGLAKTLSVMPGDRVKLEVYAKFVDPQPTNRTTALNTLLSQISAGSTSIVVDGPQYSTSSTSFPFPGLLDKSASTEEGPKVYLNWLVFDRNFKFVDGGYRRLSNAPRETGQDVTHERLNTELHIKEAGYVYMYYSNENETVLEAYFDDFGVEHIASPVVQINDYYPYGHAYRVWVREGEDELRDKFQGKDLNPKTKLHDFHARQYEATLGRFLGVDPKNQFASGYVGMGNNPVMGVDPDGEWVHIAVGAVIGGVSSYISGRHAGLRGWDLAGFTVAGAGIGAMSGGAGAAASSSVSASLGTGFVAGAAAGATGGAVGGAIGGFGSTAFANGYGLSDTSPFKAGLRGGIRGGISGGLIGGVSGGIRYAKRMTLFSRGNRTLGIQDGDPVPQTDDFLHKAQKTWYPDAPMENVRNFTVENVPANYQATLDGYGAGAMTKSTSVGGVLTGNSSVYFNKNLAFTSAKRLFFAMGHEFVHVSQYASLAGQSTSLLSQPGFIDLLEYHAYNYEYTVLGSGNYGGFTPQDVGQLMTHHPKYFHSMAYRNFSWTTTTNFIYPFK